MEKKKNQHKNQHICMTMIHDFCFFTPTNPLVSKDLGWAQQSEVAGSLHPSVFCTLPSCKKNVLIIKLDTSSNQEESLKL